MRGRCRRVKEWFHNNYIFFSPKAFFILGLVLSQSFAEYAAVCCLIVYFTHKWKKQHLPEAVAIIKVQDGVTIVLSHFLAYVADSCMGRFKVVFFTTVAYILGLTLLWCSAKYHSPTGEINGFYAGAVILVVGMAGQNLPLRAFLADQLSDEIGNPTEEKQEEIDDRTDILWRVARFSGATIALVSLPNAKWEMAFRVSALVMGATLLLFLFGYGLSFYKLHKPDGSSSRIILRVLMAARHNWSRNYPRTEKGFYWKNHKSQPGLIEKSHGQTYLLPKVLFLRRLDKAAVIDERTPPVSPKEQELLGHLCTAEPVSQVKRLFSLIPIWTSFLGCSLVAATGNTFFYEQTSNMDFYIANNIKVPLNVLFALRSIIRDIIPYMFWSKKARQQHVTRIRIGVGMICSALCCFVAWQVEVHRLYLIEEENIDPFDSNQTISMSVLWLFPQFILLGLMEGLASDGLQEFFYKHVATSMRSYGSQFNDCVLGIGNFISLPIVLGLRSWFKDTINTSHVDKYYLTLAILSSVFFVFYVYASYSITSVHMGSPSNDEESNESLEDGTDELADQSGSTRNIAPCSQRSNPMGNASEGVELNEIKVDGNDDTTRSVSSPIRRRKNVATAMTAIGFSMRLFDRFSRESPVNIAGSPESMEETLLQSQALTEAENELPDDDEPGSQ